MKNNIDNQEIKSITGGMFILYFIGIPLILFGIITKNLGLIFGGLIILPIINTLSKKHLHINFSVFARIIIAIFISIFINAFVVGLTETSNITEKQSVTPIESKKSNEGFELGIYTIESEEFKYLESKIVRAWKSFEERKILKEFKEGDKVSVVNYDSKNNYCGILISETNEVGWFSCDWLKKNY